MKAFAYQSPETVDEAVGALSPTWGKVDVLAGGTDLLALMKDGLESPETVVNIKDVKDLGGVKAGNASIWIGATTTLADLASHSSVKKHLPALASAAGAVGGPQIRNMATVGGNLCQRPRDWYFRNRIESAKRAENRYDAIFPEDGQYYVSPSTLAPALIAYGATVDIQGPDGKRSVPVEKFFRVSDLSEDGGRETVLNANQIVLGVNVPTGDVQSAEYQVRERDSHDWPLVQAAVALKVQGGKVADAKVSLGHVSPIPLRCSPAEAAIKGKAVTMETAAAAGEAAAAGAKPQRQNVYKITLVQVAVKRALLAAVGNEYWRA